MSTKKQIESFPSRYFTWKFSICFYVSVGLQLLLYLWLRKVSLPDITLLPAIARLFDITVDALLSVEQIDKKARYAEYCARCEPLYRTGKLDECLREWQRALFCCT